MASVVEPAAQTSTAGCLAKTREVFSRAYSGSKKEVTDASSSVPNSNTAFYSFKRPVEISATPNIDGAVNSSAALNIDGHVDRARTLSGSTYSEFTNGSEPIQDDGPSTPMRYLAKPKHVHVETPDSAISLPSLSLASASCYVDNDMAKQANAECNNVDSPFSSLGKFDKPESIIKAGSSNVQGVLGTLSTPEMSKLTCSEIQQPNLNIHMPVLTQSHIPQSCNSVNSAFCLQSSNIIPGKVNPIKSSVFNTNANQQIMFNNGQQGPEGTKYPQVIPSSLNGVQLNLSQGLQCEDTFQGRAARQKLRTTPPCISNQFSYPIGNGSQLEVNYMPLLQTPLMATSLGGQQALTSENNLSHSSKNGQPLAKKQKLASQKPQIGESSVGLNQCALEVRQRAANVENHHFEGGKHQKGQVKQFRSPNDKVENVKSVNGFADFPSVNGFGKLRHLAEPVTMKSSGGTNSSFTCGPLGSNVHNPSPSEAGKTPLTLPLQSTKTEIVSNQPRGNTEGQSLDVRSHPLGLRLLTFPAYAPMPAAVSTFSSGGPSLPQYINQQGNGEDSYPGKRQNPKRTSADLEWGKFLALSATPDSSVEVEETQTETLLPYQKRFLRLQAFLKQCDEPNQKYLKTLRTLSAAARSGHAVELETRAIILSLEEGKEITRMKSLNVFAKNSSNEEGATVFMMAPKVVANPL